VKVPLSEHEERVLHELEEALYRHDPAFAHRVRSETVYRHAGRRALWSAAGALAGLVVLMLTFTRSVALGFAGFVVMFVSLLALWSSLRRMGMAGLEDLATRLRAKGVAGIPARLRGFIDGRRHRPS
jgi:hypothetical protein